MKSKTTAGILAIVIWRMGYSLFLFRKNRQRSSLPTYLAFTLLDGMGSYHIGNNCHH